MRTLLFVTAASVAFSAAAFAQSTYVDRESGAAVLVDVYGQSRQAATDISRLCGVDYAMQDPDLNIQLEMRRDCSGGIEGGAGD
jgi:hypothetical protein